MKLVKTSARLRRRGSVFIISLIFVLVFSSLVASIATMSAANSQLASNQRKVNCALSAAQSGLECGKYIAMNLTLPETGQNFVSTSEADQIWTDLCQDLQNACLDGQGVSAATRFTDATGSGDQIITSSLNFGSANTDFTLKFYRYDSDPLTIKLQSTGNDGDAVRHVATDLKITKDSEVLTYAIASRGRMWLTGDSTIHGDIFSSWDRPEISPFNITSDSSVLGTINTVLTLDQIKAQSYQMETLDVNDNPIDVNGAPLGTNYEDRYFSSDDEIQGYHEGINYGQPFNNMPGMDISDYNTDSYSQGLTDLSSSYTVREYFPHVAGNYSLPSSSGSRRLDRHVYENQTFTNVQLPSNRNALFKNCTFEGILYVDCNKNTSTYYNNVRFEDCTFNGTIITDVPQTLKWQYNCLYFTGAATFNNNSGLQEATILAPHFNVNLGNTNPEQSDNNVLTGAIIGGIVDVRGNAQIYGTIISMCDTTQWSSGYVTNIGATLNDGGSETTELGDIGVIDITPDEDKMLPSGIMSPIIIKPLQGTYTEG